MRYTKFSHYVLLVLIPIVSLGCQSSRVFQDDRDVYSFALIGDMPYGPGGVAKFENLIADINSDGALQWVVHAGDIKTGGTPCSDEFLEDRVALFRRFTKPFFIIPGDNEWTDCHRGTAGQFDPLERLAAIRKLFYPEPNLSPGKTKLNIETQASEDAYSMYPEHVRWERGDVLFANLHIVGSNNGMAPFEGRTDAHDEEVTLRMQASIEWMQDTFKLAAQKGSVGLFLMIHANPQFGENNEAFAPFLKALERETIAYGLPVLLAHGDSHYFRIDKPLVHSNTGQRIENFTRVETFGAGDIHWLRIVVDPHDVNVFSIRQEIVTLNRENHQ